MVSNQRESTEFTIKMIIFNIAGMKNSSILNTMVVVSWKKLIDAPLNEFLYTVICFYNVCNHKTINIQMKKLINYYVYRI